MDDDPRLDPSRPGATRRIPLVSRRDGPPPPRSTVGVVLQLASGLCGLAAAAMFVLPLVRGEVSGGTRYVTLTPGLDSAGSGSSAAVEVAPGQAREERSNFKGAILMLNSEPSGATVVVGGQNQGETPVSVGADCVPGKPISVTFSMRGYDKVTHETLCPEDTLVKVTARLQKSTGKASRKK